MITVKYTIIQIYLRNTALLGAYSLTSNKTFGELDVLGPLENCSETVIILFILRKYILVMKKTGINIHHARNFIIDCNQRTTAQQYESNPKAVF